MIMKDLSVCPQTRIDGIVGNRVVFYVSHAQVTLTGIKDSVRKLSPSKTANDGISTKKVQFRNIGSVRIK